MNTRLSGFMLCIAALIVQIGMGCLPTGDVCLGCTASREARTCCCRSDGPTTPANPVHACCRGKKMPARKAGDGSRRCDRCVMVRVPDHSATTTARAMPDRGFDWPIAAVPCITVATPAPVLAFEAILPRPTESPPPSQPGLAPILTIRLVL